MARGPPVSRSTISPSCPPVRWSTPWRSRPGSIVTPELRVALDGRALGDGHGTGVARYIQALITAFSPGRGVDLVVYRPGGPRVLGPQLLAPLRMRRERARLLHGPANALPLLPVGLPAVVTIHDLAIYDHSEWFPPRQWFSTRVVVPASARQARLVIVPSEATRRAVSRILGIPTTRCRVIPHGVEAEFSRPASTHMLDRIRDTYGLPPRYLLQVGTIQPRKNYETTLRALARLPVAERVPLIIAGGFGWAFDPVVRLVADLRLTDWVRFIGYVGIHDLPALYQMASVVIFPSLDEGFGLPVLEAFAAGTPVAASDAGAVPEVAGDAALLSPAQDDEALAEHIARLLNDAALRERQIVAGRARAASYTWEASAAAHRAAYLEAVGG